MPFFFTNRIAAISRYIVELVLRDRRFSYTLITTNGAQRRECDVGFDSIVPIRVKGHKAFYRRARNVCKAYDLVTFYGGFLGAVLFMKSFAGKGIPSLLNVFSYKFSLSDIRYLKKTDYHHAFQRIFLHQYLWSAIIPNAVFRRYFRESNANKVICPSQRLADIYGRIVGEKHCACLRPGGDISRIGGCDPKLPGNLAKRLDGKITVLHSGLASLLRGSDDLIRAYAAMPERLRSACRLFLCLYVTPGEKIYSVERIKGMLAEYLRNEEYILWDTPVSNLHSVYHRADICVFPYRYSGDIPEVPLTLVELAHLGKRVISNDIGCISEFIPRRDLCKAGAVTELRDKIAGVVAGLLEEKQVGPKAGQFGWDRYVHGYAGQLWEMLQ